MSDVEGLAEDERAELHPCYSHLHEAVERILAARVQAARAEALEEAADELDSVGHHWSGAPAHEFFDLARDLRARAAALRADDAGGEGL